jgi:glycyl-tRNA synthetase (class II)
VTTDFDTLDDRAVTVRERDAMTQDRIGIDAVPDYLRYDPRSAEASSPASQVTLNSLARKVSFV